MNLMSWFEGLYILCYLGLLVCRALFRSLEILHQEDASRCSYLSKGLPTRFSGLVVGYVTPEV